MVLQYNKRDLPNALPVEILNEKLNPRGLPFYEAVAVKGQGVEETLKGVTATVFRSLASKYGGAVAAPGAQEPPAPAPKPSAPDAPAVPAANPAAAPSPPAAPKVAPPRPAPVAAAVASAAAPSIAGSAEELVGSFDVPSPAAAESFQDFGLEDLQSAPSAEPDETELEELPTTEPELSLEAIDDEEIVEDDEIASAPFYSALDDQGPRARSRGMVSTAPVSVDLSAASGTTDIAIPVDVSLRDGDARVQLQIRLTLNLNLRR
jgi:hypothetical protein